MRAFR
jgi:hypothetical protein